MHRIAEQIVLWTTLIATSGLALGLTWLPCYATVCSESLFPGPTRYHIGVQAGIIAGIMILLSLRAQFPLVRTISEFKLARRRVPLMGRHLSIGGLVAFIWIVGIILATLAFWKAPIFEFWMAKGRSMKPSWNEAAGLLTVVTDIAHHADSLLGLVLIPVGRNSLVGRTFKVHQSTLLFAHTWLAYFAILDSLAHGIAYFVFLGTYDSVDPNDVRRRLFDVNNPTLTVPEVSSKGNYYALNFSAGLITWVAMAVMVLTSLPWVRRRHYNIFYRCHVAGAIIAFVFASIHASTDFYFLLPGLVLWMYDWAWRIYGGGSGLSKTVEGSLEDAGDGWYRIRLPPSARMHHDMTTIEKQSTPHAIQSYYLNIPSISKTENHAFTAAEVGDNASGPLFLFQQAPAIPNRPVARQDAEWTWKLARAANTKALAGDSSESETDLSEKVQHNNKLELRVEGPYFPADRGYESASHVICIVGGTGLTGAISLAVWWLQNRAAAADTSFSLVWLIRHPETANLQEWMDLKSSQSERAPTTMNLILHVSSQEGRMDSEKKLRSLADAAPNKRSTWIYASGPPGLLTAVEDCSLKMESELKPRPWSRSTPETQHLSHYIARWET